MLHTLLLLLPLATASAPGKPLIMSFSSRSVLLSWTPASSLVSQYRVRVRQGEEGAWGDARTLDTHSRQAEYNVTGLRPFAVYSFKVVAVIAGKEERREGRGEETKEEQEEHIEAGEEREEESAASYYMITLREAPSGVPTITSAYNTSSRCLPLLLEILSTSSTSPTLGTAVCTD